MVEYNSIQRALMDYLMGQGPNPFATAPSDVPLPGFFAMPEDEDEYGTLDYQNDRATFAKKANDLVSDPATIAQLGIGAGGAGPEQFEPVITYEEVNVPGFQKLQRYMQSANPIDRYIAETIAEGGSAGEAEMDIRRAIASYEADPEANEGGLGQAFAEALPTYSSGSDSRTRVTDAEPYDFDYVRDVGQDLESAILSDDPWDRQTFDPVTKRPARRVEGETEIARYYREMGIPNPYVPYDQSVLAEPGEIRAEDKAKAKYDELARGTGQVNNDVLAAQRYMEEAQRQKPMPGGGSQYGPSVGFRQPAPDNDGFNAPGVLDYLDFGELGGAVSGLFSGVTPTIGRVGEGESGGKIPLPGFRRDAPETTGRLGEDLASIIRDREQQRRASDYKGAQSRVRNRQLQTSRNYNDALGRQTQHRQAVQSAFRDREKALYEQQKRRMMTRAMLQAGIGPAQDTIRARQQNVFGF